MISSQNNHIPSLLISTASPSRCRSLRYTFPSPLHCTAPAQCCRGQGWLGTGQVRGKSQGSSSGNNFNVKFASDQVAQEAMSSVHSTHCHSPGRLLLFSQIPKLTHDAGLPLLLSRPGLYHTTADQDMLLSCEAAAHSRLPRGRNRTQCTWVIMPQHIYVETFFHNSFGTNLWKPRLEQKPKTNELLVWAAPLFYR